MDFYIEVGDKVKFRKVEDIKGNEELDIKKGKWYEVVKTKYNNPRRAFIVVGDNNQEFYISFTEHNHIKKIKRGEING